MIFLCFSVKDRDVINIIYNQLMDFGLDVWYDKKNTGLGENREITNLENGAKNKNIKYAAIFYSDNFVNGRICIDEYKILEKRYRSNDITLFPVFLDGDIDYVPDEFRLCTELVFKAIKNKETDYYSLAAYIVARIIKDQLSTCKIKELEELTYNVKLDKYPVLSKMLAEYSRINKGNYNLRLGLLVAIFIQIKSLSEISYMHNKAISYIYYKACNSPLLTDNKEFVIIEGIITYYLNKLILL